MDLAARIEGAAGGASNLVGKSEVTMSGKAAAFGGRMMNAVADQILKQFADNFAAQGACGTVARRTCFGAASTRDSQRRLSTSITAAAAAERNGLALMGRKLAARPRRPSELNGHAPAWARHRKATSCAVVRAVGGMNAAAQRMNEVVDLQRQLQDAGYIAERPLAAALLLMLDLGRPLLLEGDAGVGKTEVAKALAAVRGAKLIRLQCYEGLDVHAAMYEWNYQRQLLAIKLLEHDERPVGSRSRTSSPSAIC